jgi:hypothetical protein
MAATLDLEIRRLLTTSRMTAFNWRADDFRPSDVSPCLDTDSSGSIATGVRRLMPVECERLQGLPDDWTRYGRREDGEVYELANGPRYKMIGNGGFVGAVEWISRRMLTPAASPLLSTQPRNEQPAKPDGATTR